MKFTEWNCLCLWVFFLSGQRRTAGGGSERNETWRAAPHTPALAALRLCEFFVMAGMKFSFFVIYCVNILLQASYFLFFFLLQTKGDKRTRNTWICIHTNQFTWWHSEVVFNVFLSIKMLCSWCCRGKLKIGDSWKIAISVFSFGWCSFGAFGGSV